MEIDLINAWRICDQWLPWASASAKRKLFWSERYSELIQLNRVETKGVRNSLVQWGNRAQFVVAKWRLKHQIFAGSQFEFFLHQNRIRLRPTAMHLIRSLRKRMKTYLPVDGKVNYRNFGYIPSGSLKDVVRKVMGHVNLLKRLQAKDLMGVLDIQENDLVLDFGCGSGYFTVEMAKLAHRAYGMDITSYLTTIEIPSPLAGKLGFVMGRGEDLPFRDNSFDKILASEILPMTKDPQAFLLEMRRVIRKGGRLVICNGAGHPSVKNAYQRGHWFLKLLKRVYGERVPSSYETYCSKLQESFGTCQKSFLQKEEIVSLLEKAGLQVEEITYSPSSIVGSYISWSQFLLWLRKRRALSQRYFHLVYPVANMINAFARVRYEGGLICSARKN